MSKLFVDQKVFVMADNHELKRGTIHSIFDHMNQVIVRFDNGTYEKVDLDQIIVKEETKPEEPVKKERREKDVITITPEDLRRIGADVINEFGQKTENLGMLVATLFMSDLHKKLFDEESEDE